MPAGWTPPVVENANELPWEQNPYFIPALEAVGITTVGADASKAYPNPPDDQFGDRRPTYTGATYAAGQPFVDGTAQVAPRHPINIFYNASTNAQELDEYNTLYNAVAPGSQCQTPRRPRARRRCTPSLRSSAASCPACSRTCSATTPSRPTSTRPTSWARRRTQASCPRRATSPPATAQTRHDGDGLLYEVLNPLLAEYAQPTSTATTPYEQLTLGGIGNILADQTAWASTLSASPRR